MKPTAHVSVLAAVLLLVASSCGTGDDLAQPKKGEAQVIVENAEPTGDSSTPTESSTTAAAVDNQPAGGDSSSGNTSSSAAATGDSNADGSGAAASEVDAIASEIRLTSEKSEMNLQPDDTEWGLLSVDDAYATLEVGDLTASSSTKLVVVDYQVTPIIGGNHFERAFRLQADGEWYSSLASVNTTLNVGDVFNRSLVFEVPREAMTLTLEGGLPEAIGVGRRATYEIILVPGKREVVSVDNAAAEATGEARLTSENAEMNLQPDDGEWGILAVDSVVSTLLFEEVVATNSTKLIVVDYQVTPGEGGNHFSRAFRIEAGGEWYSPLTNINTTLSVGDVYNGTLVFEVPREPTTITLEAGLPMAIYDYGWDFGTRTATFEIVLS